MPDSKITALASTGTGTDPANDPLVIVDVSDTSMAATGTTKKVTLNQLLACSPTATLASATITGDLTVDTNVLKVDTTNNRVGIGTASPTAALDVFGVFGTSTAAAVLRNNSAANNSNIVETQYFASNNNSGLDCIAKFGALNPLATGNNYGQFYWQIANAGSPTTAMTLNSTGLGVGVSPAFKIHANGVIGTTNTFGAFTALQTAGGTGYRWTLANDNNFYLQYSPDGFGSTATSRIALDSSGNVGIGVTPSAWNAGFKVLQVNLNGVVYGNGGSSFYFGNNYYTDSSGTNRYLTSTAASGYGQVSGAHQWLIAPSGTAGNSVGFTQAMTLDASGRLLVGTTSAIAKFSLSYSYPNTGIGLTTDSNSTQTAIQFNTPGGLAGFINTNSTTTTYNSASDYRLKESVAPITGGLARVNALKPSTYKWKVDGSNGEGFIAHELAEIVPDAVSGEKDAVNANGSIKPQGVDLSRVVPILVAAIQELTARVQTLEAK